MTEQYVAWFKDPQTGALIRVYTQADNVSAARSLFEAQYGSANVWGIGPV